jgi:hypothetical protein
MTPNNGFPAPDPFSSQAADVRRKQTTMMIVIGVLLAIVAAIVGLSAAGVLRFGRETPKTGTLQAKGVIPDNRIMAKPSVAPTPVLEKGGERPEMPADVEAWLKHLQEVERRKVALTGDQMAEVTVFMQKNSVLGAGMGLMNPYDQAEGSDEDKEPSTYTKSKILDLRPQWDDLITFYYSVPPPEECKPLADDYGRAINEIPGMMGDLGEMMNGVANDPQTALQQAKKMQNGSYDGIDRYFARSDQKLGDICTKYQKSKWFNIATDVAAGGMLSKQMMGGLGGGALGGTP